MKAETATLHEIAAEVLDRALHSGASDAEVALYEGDEFSVKVRLGEVETLKDSGSRAIGLRVYLAGDGADGQRAASTSTSNLSPESLERLVAGAVSLARIASPDPYAGLPELASLGKHDAAEQHLFSEDVGAQPPAERIALARACEAAALAYDPRIQNSGGADFDAATAHRVLMNSRGFAGEYRRSYCGFSTQPIAHDEHGAMQRNYWYTSARSVRLLDDPESVGREAARRTLRRLGARRVKTQRAPVVLAPEIARSLIYSLFDAANGDAIYRRASFLTGKLGEQVANENITLIDDGTLVFNRADGMRVGGFGTAPYDGEGLPTRRTVLVEKGILRSYACNTYTGRKLGLPSTGNASRSLAGSPGIGAGNFFLEPGTLSPEQILAEIPNGLYVTETMGFGVNLVTGDYSQGAAGIWIENGELAYPVEEITIAGTLQEMFRNVSAIGSDLDFRSSTAAPTLRIDGMTIAGS